MGPPGSERGWNFTPSPLSPWLRHRSYWRKFCRDLRWHHMHGGQPATSCTRFIAKLHLNRQKSKNKWKDPPQEIFAWIGSRHDLQNKVIAQQPTLIETFHSHTLWKKWKVSFAKKKSDLYLKNYGVQAWKNCLRGGIQPPPPIPVLARVKTFSSLVTTGL